MHIYIVGKTTRVDAVFLIDCYIYEVNAVMKRYKYLLEQAAAMELVPENKHGETYRALSLFS